VRVTQAAAVRRRPITAALAAVGFLAIGGALWLWTALAHRDRRPNVLIITVDTLRADHVGSYGYAAAQTPAMDALAARGAIFTRATTVAPLTLPAHSSLMTGMFPAAHGVRDNGGFYLADDRTTLATILKRQGYRTGGFVAAFVLDRRFGLNRGFDLYDDEIPRDPTLGDHLEAERRGDAVADRAVAWLAQNDARPFFAWVHFYDAHFPYAGGYDAEVAFVDAQVKRLLDAVDRENTIVVIAGDHGEALGEHGELTHGLFAYEPTLHVPLILYQPRLFGPRVVAEPVRHVDILPSILDAIGAPAPQGVDGRSLLPSAHGEPAQPAVTYFESLSASINRGWAPLYGVATGSLKYIELPIPELYDLSADPGETRNIASSRAADVQQLQKLLAGFRSAGKAPEARRETTATREQLRSLGYVAGTAAPRERYTEDDDPKRLIALDRALEEVVSRYQQGDLAGAIAAGERVARERPDMPLSLVHLAFLYNEAGDHRRAVDAIRRALALNPSADDVAALAGAYLTEAGRAAEAVHVLEPYTTVAKPDVDVLIAYGVALASAGRRTDALAAFGRAREIDPQNGLPLADAGTVYLMAGDRRRAAEAFRAALTVDPTLARAHNGLGVVAAEQRDYDVALDHWKRAVELDPRDFETLFNIGDLLVRLRRDNEARVYWTRYLQVAPASQERSDRKRVSEWLAAHR